MERSDQHDGAPDGEHESQDRSRGRGIRSTSAPSKEAKLVPVKGTGLSGPFVRRPVMTVLLTLSVIVAGIATYNKLAVNDLPAVDYPIIQVTCSYPGADPVTMANNIATPLEKQFLQIPGLDIITSQSTQSNTSLTLQFVLSKSITDAATDVQAAIQRATGKLPIDLPSPPTFSKTNPNDQAVYLLGLMSDTMTDGDLYKYASTAVAQRISILPGVSQVNIYGVQGAIRIKADPAALAARGLTMDDVANAIKAGTVYSGAGQFDGAHRSFVLQPNGQIDQVGAGVRSFPDDCEFRSRRSNDARDRFRAGSDGDLCFSRSRYRYADSGGRAAAFVAAHVRGNEHARIFDQQLDVNGADTRH